MAFERIDMAQWPRREHYQYYNEQIRTNYEMNVELDVTKLKKRCRKKEIHFYPAMMYAIMYSINHHENFRMAVDEEGHLGVCDVCHPSYTIFHKDDATFSDIWTEWNEDFHIFYKDVCKDMKQYAQVKGIKAKPDRPDAFTPVSCVPWVSFTSVGHDTPGPRQMYFPVIVFGRYHKVHERWKLPFSIMVNHAVADGYHTSMLVNDIQAQCDHCKKWLRS